VIDTLHVHVSRLMWINHSVWNVNGCILCSSDWHNRLSHLSCDN